MKTIATIEKNTHSSVNPKVFMMWSFLGTIIMMFAGLTSAYIVRKGAGDWTMYKLPELFTISTIVIILSSATLYWSFRALKNEQFGMHRLSLGITFLLGLAFVALQYGGWQELMSYNIRLQGNPSGSFLYIISGLHAAHVLGGIVFLFIFLMKSLFRKDPVDKLLEELNPERFQGYSLLNTYWHFVGVLWIYLFLFFWFNS